VDQTKSRQIFEEALAVILQAWTQERVNFEGAHFRFHDVEVHPRPVQKPHPPVWIAAVSPESFVYAGEHGYNLLCGPLYALDVETLRRELDVYRESLVRAGHDPATREIGALEMVYAARSAEQAVRDFSEPAVWCFRAFSNYIGASPDMPPIETYEHYSKIRDFAAAATWRDLVNAGAVVCGAPDGCIEQIARLRERLGFTTLLCWTRVGGIEHRKVLESMAIMQESVMPAFRRRAAA
jgi:alkanesulfonate monooxygenase SsuD/methylene tetrahydromethanopterin reductase-like flavin-dependent oxidoreductase (luciferase family)